MANRQANFYEKPNHRPGVLGRFLSPPSATSPSQQIQPSRIRREAVPTTPAAQRSHSIEVLAVKQSTTSTNASNISVDADSVMFARALTTAKLQLGASEAELWEANAKLR
ncbi:unnamed protein product [Adineta steineri]|uniref:Uncharacterized protein n=1 Tax=Adineta steineri TaxID=433720 RepID=A0A813XV73_9BILA|nr:unnamed protein product [Adineta steineri]CAF3983761.1 unnamed protein product [Adineta steineri]